MTDLSDRTTASEKDSSGQFPAGRAWYAVALLFLLYCISFTDRMVLSLLAAPVSAALRVSDTQIGLLFGLGFGVIYAIMGLPLAHLVDRRHRVGLITIGVAVWSACTVASGFAPNYTALMLLRGGVAIGEAVLSPAAISLIADMFPRDRRTLPTSIYTAPGTFMGAGAFIVGGLALELATSLSANLGLPPWQLTMVFVGLPGLLLAPLLFLTVPEAPRGQEPKAQDLSSAKQAIAFVVKERRLYGFLALGVAAYTVGSFAKIAWVPTLMVRGYGMKPSDAGYIYGTLGVVAGLVGAVAWPMLAEYWTKRGRKDAIVTLFAIGVTLSSFCLLTVGLTRTPAVLFVALMAQTFLGSCTTLLPPLIIQSVAPGRIRGRLMAGNFMASNLIGLTVGPTLAAFISDQFFDGPFAIAGGITVIACIVTPVAGISIWLARPRYRMALDEAVARESGTAIAEPTTA